MCIRDRILTIAARSDLAKDASRILIRLSQIFLINMAFVAYVLENAILLFSLGVAFARFFKAPPWGFCMNRPASRGGGGKDFSSFTKEKWQMPDRSDRCAGDGHVWNWLSHYHLSLPPGGIITPGEDYHLSLPRGLLGLLHHCVEKSDLLSIFGLLHLSPLFLTNILV